MSSFFRGSEIGVGSKDIGYLVCAGWVGGEVDYGAFDVVEEFWGGGGFG